MLHLHYCRRNLNAQGRDYVKASSHFCRDKIPSLHLLSYSALLTVVLEEHIFHTLSYYNTIPFHTCLKMGGHSVQLGKIVEDVDRLRADLLGDFVSLDIGQVRILEHELSVDDTAGRIQELPSSLPQGSETFGVEAGGVGDGIHQDVLQHEQPSVGLFIAGQDVSQGAVQRGKPENVPLFPAWKKR